MADKQPTPEEVKAKQAAQQAVYPAPPQFIQDAMKEARQETATPDEEMKLLKELSQSDAWKSLKKYIRAKQKRLGDMTAQSVRGANFDLQNIGFRYLIFDQVKEALEDIVRKVEQPAKIQEIERAFEEGGEDDAS